MPKIKSKPCVAVFRDGLLARRNPELLEPAEAEKVVRAMNHLPTILEAWAHPIPRSRRRMVCWLPASARAQATMERTLRTTEEAKAKAEGTQFIWSPTSYGPHVRACYNPKSGRAYLVTQETDGHVRCQCPRFQSAGICKHVCAAKAGSPR